MDQAHQYDLAFVAPKRRPRTAPEIVFIINEQHLSEVRDNLWTQVNRFYSNAASYLGDEYQNFTLPVPDLFGHKVFGYNQCGYWTVEDGKVYFRIQLGTGMQKHYCALTIFMLVRALATRFVLDVSSNQNQEINLTTCCERRTGGYGHAMGGYLSKSVLKWLQQYAKDKLVSGIIEAAPMHPDVISAMQAAWYAVSNQNLQHYASTSHIYGWVRETGAFSMVCFGDACDLGIYPNRWLGGEYESAELGCHNLDTADQQLTLLAGLAKICQLASESS